MYHFRKSFTSNSHPASAELYLRGFTLIELVVVISIVGILSAGGSWLLIFFVENFSFLPDKLNINMATSDILDIICEGDAQAGGVRFSNQITEIADNQLSFTDQDNQNITIQLSGNKVYRSIGAGDLELIPYYVPSSLNVAGKETIAFQYYDESGIITGVAASVRRVEINLVASIGDRSTELKTAISLRK